jgi:hypothetical protein
MEFIIDSTLKINEEETNNRYNSVEYFLERHFEFKDSKFLESNISGDLYHRNYMAYLEHCWAKHYGIIISPDIIWHIFLNELATHIKNNSEDYRVLFTNSSEKKTIRVPYRGNVLDLNTVVKHLKALVPTNVDLFLPEFSTTDAGASFAFMAAFADAVSPYYNYSMYLCGVSKIKITGTQEDWGKMLTSVGALKDYFPILLDYFERICSFVSTIIKQFTEPDAGIMGHFFFLKRCGSGGQVEVGGWVRDLYIDNKPRVAYPENFSSSISVVKYELEETKQKFELRCGLFSSTVSSDTYLVPNFGYVVHEVELSKISNNDENNRRSKERAV